MVANLLAERGRRSVFGAALVAFGTLGAFVAPGGALRAQPVRTTVENQTAWYTVFGDHALGGKWALWYDVHFRREGIPGERWQQLLIRPGITYDLAPGMRATAGYAYIVTHQYGDDPIGARFPEHRIWQQLTLAQKTGPIAWSHRFRFEQRYLGVMSGDPEPVVDSWRYTQRLRYFLRATHDVGKSRAYLTAYDELFIGVGKDVKLNILEQNRLFAGVGWKFTPTFRAEAGYMEQQIIRPNGTRVERNHTLTVAAFTTAPFRR